MISFIIPAHNEELLLGRTLAALHRSAQALGEPYEVIVANDASTDRTGAIAQEHGARVVAVQCRQIAATRNAGALAATGDLFFFVDADTLINRRALRAAVRTLRRGAVGGGSNVLLDGRLPLYTVLLRLLLPPILRAFRLAPGCFLFCTRQAYCTAGGFDESLYVTEEVAFGHQLKRQGRFVILREYVISSGRKLKTHSALDLLRIAARLTLGGPQALQRREGLDYWYGPRKALP